MFQISIFRSIMRFRSVGRMLTNDFRGRHFSIDTPIYKASTAPTKDRNSETDKPIQYFNSPASRWKAEHTRSGHVKQDMPWFQPYVVIASTAVFLIYFCILREENDIDRGLEKSLYEHVPGLEEKQLVLSYHYNKEHGLSTIAIEQRMKELGLEL